MLDIIVPHYGSGNLLYSCIKCIEENTPMGSYQLYIIDNNDINRGFASAVNLGIQTGINPYIAILNNDTNVVAHWSEKLLNTLINSAHNIGAIGPLSSAATQWQSAENISGLLNKKLPINKIITSDEVSFDIWLAFWCIIIPRSVFDDVGLLDEQFFMYGEDDDWCIRAKRKGYKLGLDLSLVVNHLHRANYNAEIRLVHQESREKFKAKWGFYAQRKWAQET